MSKAATGRRTPGSCRTSLAVATTLAAQRGNGGAKNESRKAGGAILLIDYQFDGQYGPGR